MVGLEDRFVGGEGHCDSDGGGGGGIDKEDWRRLLLTLECADGLESLYWS